MTGSIAKSNRAIPAHTLDFIAGFHVRHGHPTEHLGLYVSFFFRSLGGKGEGGERHYLAVLVRFASEDIGAGLELGDAEAELGVAGVEWVDFVRFGVGVAGLKIVGGGEGCEGEEGEECRIELHVCWFGRWWSAQPVEFALKR